MREKIYYRKLTKNLPYCNNEANTKNYLINNVLKYINIDTKDPYFIEYEFPIPLSTNKIQYIDYVLKKNNKPYAIIEAKTYNTYLPKYRGQLKTYFNLFPGQDDHPVLTFGILTDGLTYEFYIPNQWHKITNIPSFIITINEPKQLQEIKRIKTCDFTIDKNIIINAIDHSNKNIDTYIDIKPDNILHNIFHERLLHDYPWITYKHKANMWTYESHGEKICKIMIKKNYIECLIYKKNISFDIHKIIQIRNGKYFCEIRDHNDIDIFYTLINDFIYEYI